MSDSDEDIPIALLMKKKMEAEKAKKLAIPSSVPASFSAEKTKKRLNGEDGSSSSTAKKKKLLTTTDSPSSNGTPMEKKKKAVFVSSSSAVSSPPAKKPQKTIPAVEVSKSSSDSTTKQQQKKKSSSTTSGGSTSESKKVSTSFNVQAVEENIFGLDRMDKHNLVSAVLRRWRYCLDAWPGPLPAQPPHGYIEAHLPGLYVGSSNLFLGQLKDLRPFLDGKTPSMASMLTFKAIELKDLLVKGIKAQLADLSASPEDAKLKSKLNHELEKAGKLKVKKIERKYREAVAALTGEVLPKQDKSEEKEDE